MWWCWPLVIRQIYCNNNKDVSLEDWAVLGRVPPLHLLLLRKWGKLSVSRPGLGVVIAPSLDPVCHCQDVLPIHTVICNTSCAKWFPQKSPPKTCHLIKSRYPDIRKMWFLSFASEIQVREAAGGARQCFRSEEERREWTSGSALTELKGCVNTRM